MNPIDIIGIGADGPAGLRRELIERVGAAEFLAGGERHLGFFSRATGERFVIHDNVVALLEELAKRCPQQRCVVLASGDPLFYGIGTVISRVLGGQDLRFEPALSSMQLAFARAGVAWQDAALASVHGRELRTTLLPLLGRPKIGLFTQDGVSPARVAEFFRRFGATGYEAVVGENLGSDAERITRWATLRELEAQRFAPLNYLILRRTHYPADADRLRALAPGIPDDAFAQLPAEPVMTRQEIRSVLAGKMIGLLRPGDTVWDIGAGLGTVAIEIGVLRPHVEVLAVERNPERLALLRQNRERFDAFNVRAIEGTAPEALQAESDSPRAIFVGGSGNRLPAILADAEQRLRADGRLVANFVTLEHLTIAFCRLSGKGWRVEVTEVNVARSDALGPHTGLKPHRGVFVLSAEKPGGHP